MEITYDYKGNGSDGSKLIPGEIYIARATGAPDKGGNLREMADSVYYKYKAVRSGSLFCMYPQDQDCMHGKTLPQYMLFKAKDL